MAEDIGLIGGTGDLGTALAVHLSKKGPVWLGSREKEKAERAVKEILEEKGNQNTAISGNLHGEANDYVIASCERLILTVPYAAALETIRGLRDSFFKGEKNKLLISAVAAITKSGKFFSPAREERQEEDSLSKTIKELLPASVKVATAFQTIPARTLYKLDRLEADVFVCADESETYLRTGQIVSSIEGLRPLYAGNLELAKEVEGLTALLLNVSISERMKNPSLKVTSWP